MNDLYSVIPFVMIAVFVILCFVLPPRFDRERIRKNVEDHGGKVIEILGVWSFGNRYDRTYEVSYVTAQDRRVKATCKTSMWNGVYWVSDRPPGVASDDDPADGSSMNYVKEEPSGPAEPIQCLGCGNMISADQQRCPQCGWSYNKP